MIELVSVDNMRRSDKYTIDNFVDSKELMYRAGLGVYNSVEWTGPVAVVCGSGNNAGDGFVIAKLLHDNNIDCCLYIISDKMSEDGRYYFEICRDAGVAYKFVNRNITDENQNEVIQTAGINSKFSFKDYKMIVDCIFGTGFHGTVKGIAADIIKAINESGAYVVSVDINSGLNGDSGMAELCVKSDLTVAVGSFKPGHFLNMAKDMIKSKVNVDIGIKPLDKPYKLLEVTDLTEVFPKRKNHSNKGTYGYLALIGGSLKYNGAIRLAYMANAAMRSGAGVVKLATPKSICRELIPNILETTLFPLSDNDGDVVFVREEIDSLIKNVKTVAFGMGIGLSEESAKILEYLLKVYKGTLIIDADGLTIFSKIDKELIKNAGCKLVLTPHIKEFSRLTGCELAEIFASPIEKAKNYAKENGLVLLLKGPSTIITDGEEVFITDRGCAGMATAGSGDVLSGIVAATCAYCKDLLLATAAAAYINGRAGELAEAEFGSISMIAGDTVAKLPAAIMEIQGIERNDK